MTINKRYTDASLTVISYFLYTISDDIKRIIPFYSLNLILTLISNIAGVFPQIKENNYYNNGVYRIDADASPIMKNCLMYKLAYYRFDEVTTQQGKPTGYDTVRNAEIGHKGFKLKHFREAYTSERWIVRIYEVMPLANMDPALKPKFGASAPTEKSQRVKISTRPAL